jgi:glycosyltransferase involved in cell wall biosynthesis
VGRLTYPKDPITFIRAAKIVLDQSIDAKFLWVGEGELIESANEEIKRLKLQEKVSMLGWQDDAIKWLGQFDIFVHSSWYEAFGLVVAEAMALSKPVVAADITGVKDIVADGMTGILYEAGNHVALALGILKLAENRKLMEEMGTNGRKRVVEKFTLASMVNEISNLYLRLSSAEIVSSNH